MKRLKLKIIKSSENVLKWNIFYIIPLSHKHYLRKKYRVTGYFIQDIEKYIKNGFN